MKIGSGPLTSDEILRAIPMIEAILSSSGIDRITVYYGWGTPLEIGDLWKPFQLSISGLQSFADVSLKKGLFSPGNTDLIIEDEKNTVQVLLCHESDIHVITDNTGIIHQFRERWADRADRDSLK